MVGVGADGRRKEWAQREKKIDVFVLIYDDIFSLISTKFSGKGKFYHTKAKKYIFLMVY